VGDSVEDNFPRCRLGPLNRVLLRAAVQEHVEFRHFGNPTAIDFRGQSPIVSFIAISLLSPMRSGGPDIWRGALMVVDQMGLAARRPGSFSGNRVYLGYRTSRRRTTRQ